MRTVGMPKLQFSKWYSWEDRDEFPLRKYPGVYILGISSENLAGKMPRLDQICYVGKTVAILGLFKRWNQFNKTIKNGSGNHSGGIHMFKKMGSYTKWQKKLFVAALAIKTNMKEISHKNLTVKARISYLEYEAIAKVFKRTGNVPEYNLF